MRADGRSHPIASGYRPVCRFGSADGTPTDVGLCELATTQPTEPGAAGAGVLSFDESVSPAVRELATVGAEFGLAEGSRVVATAVVRQTVDV